MDQFQGACSGSSEREEARRGRRGRRSARDVRALTLARVAALGDRDISTSRLSICRRLQYRSHFLAGVQCAREQGDQRLHEKSMNSTSYAQVTLQP